MPCRGGVCNRGARPGLNTAKVVTPQQENFQNQMINQANPLAQKQIEAVNRVPGPEETTYPATNILSGYGLGALMGLGQYNPYEMAASAMYGGLGSPNFYSLGGQNLYQGLGIPNYYDAASQNLYSMLGQPSFYDTASQNMFGGLSNPNYYQQSATSQLRNLLRHQPNFDAIRRDEMRRFQTETVPALGEMFGARPGQQTSGNTLATLGAAGAGLHSRLAAMQQQFDMQQQAQRQALFGQTAGLGQAQRGQDIGLWGQATGFGQNRYGQDISRWAQAAGLGQGRYGQDISRWAQAAGLGQAGRAQDIGLFGNLAQLGQAGRGQQQALLENLLNLGLTGNQNQQRIDIARTGQGNELLNILSNVAMRPTLENFYIPKGPNAMHGILGGLGKGLGGLAGGFLRKLF